MTIPFPAPPSPPAPPAPKFGDAESIARAADTIKAWRNYFRPMIIKASGELPPGTDLATIRSHVSDAFPYEKREGKPYRAWVDETNFHLGAR